MRVVLGQLPRRARDVPGERNVLYVQMCELLPMLAREGILGHEYDFVPEKTDPFADAIADAGLYYVEREMCELVSHAWRTIPPTTLTEDLSPEREGIVFFARPMSGMDADDPDRVLVLHAVLWLWLKLTATDDWAISIVWFSFMDGVWSPLGRTDWPIGHDTDTEITIENKQPQRHASQTEDRRMLATLWLLAQQHRTSSVTQYVPMNKAARRRQQRRGLAPVVNVIDVRRPVSIHEHATGQRDVEWSRRWMVSGHWRQQVYGEGRQYRRPTWIAPHVKGPADKPLVITTKVKKLA